MAALPTTGRWGGCLVGQAELLIFQSRLLCGQSGAIGRRLTWRCRGNPRARRLRRSHRGRSLGGATASVERRRAVLERPVVADMSVTSQACARSIARSSALGNRVSKSRRPTQLGRTRILAICGQIAASWSSHACPASSPCVRRTIIALPTSRSGSCETSSTTWSKGVRSRLRLMVFAA